MNGRIYLFIAKFALSKLYKYIDKNGDGKLDMVEISTTMEAILKWKKSRLNT